jgi:hypothetical protein
MPNPPGYFRRYYEEKRDEINEKRKRKYDTDPEYKERVLQASRNYRKRKRKEKEQGESICRPVGLRGLQRIQDVIDEKVGDGNMIRLMSAEAFAQFLGRSVQSLSHWESKGVLPQSPYRGVRGFRYYTIGMMEVVRWWVKDRKRLFPVDPQMFSGIERGWEALGVPLADNVTGYNDALKKSAVLTRRVAVGDGSMVRLFPAKSLAIFLEVTTNAVRGWERSGKIPRTPYQNGGETYYTWKMMEEIRQARKDGEDSPDGREIELMWRRIGVPFKAQSWRRALAFTTSSKDE